MVLVSEKVFRAVSPHVAADKRMVMLACLNEALERYEINTPQRIACFLAQAAHETMGFQRFIEIWGPTEDQKEYEPPSKKASELGNTQRGDGFLFRGRGVFMLTGRDNYRRFGRSIGFNLEAEPGRAAEPELSFLIAGA